MTLVLWWVVLTHGGGALFYFVRALTKWRAKERRTKYRGAFFVGYLATGMAFGFARELRLLRVEVAGALSFVCAAFGTLFLLFIYDAHLRTKTRYP